MSYWSRSFEGQPEHLKEVREFTRFVAGDRDGADLVEMVASELAGNAIQHSESGRPGGRFTLQVGDFQNGWQVRVVDEGGPTVPRVCTLTSIDSVEDLDVLGDEVESGRGLAMVAGVSSAWGVGGDHSSRSVWAQILIPRKQHRDRLAETTEECGQDRGRR
jgi:serine/threonine-protein kinase RsbW